MRKKILVLFQDWEDWFRKDYSRFEHWFKKLDGAYSKNNEYFILSLSNNKGRIQKEKNVTVELFKSTPLKQIQELVRFRKRLKQIIKEFNPDYIYSPFIYLLSTVPKPKSRRFKIVGFLRDKTAEIIKKSGGIKYLAGNIIYALDFVSFRKIDVLLYNSNSLRKYTKQMMFSKKMIFSPRLIQNQELYSKAKKHKVINKYKLKNKKVILTVARLSSEKNIEMCINALSILPMEYFYLVVGEGHLKKGLVNLAKQKGVDKRIKILGFKKYEELPSYYKAADIFWLMSKTEGMPNTLQESLFAGLPSIVSKIEPMKNLVENNKTGIILNSWDPKELAEKTELLINNKKKYNNIRKNGIKKIKDIMKKHVDVLKVFK